MDYQVSQALRDFTLRYEQHWQSVTGHLPASRALYGVPSPCIIGEEEELVTWQPCQPSVNLTLEGVERALDLQLQPAVHAFYCSQLAGDMAAQFDGQDLELLQIWSEEDAVRMQQNLIGHLLMQRRQKLTPTLFIATTDSELVLVSVDNLTGEVLREDIGSRKRQRLAATLQEFLSMLAPRIPTNI